MIHFLAVGNNPRGDLLCRLLSDYFFALGYEHCVFDVSRAGREVDVRATHRVELREMRAEAKNQSKASGGADLNKFFGVLDAERRSLGGREIVGYFVSLAGFTGTARQQEEDSGGQRFVLIDGKAIVDELSKSTVITSPEQALERAGRCAANLETETKPVGPPELVAHGLGWLWAIRFSTFKSPSHLVLIHADGEPLSKVVADTVLAVDKQLNGSLWQLTYIEPQTSVSAPDHASIDAEYRACLARAYGAVTLEGLPADEAAGSKPLKLESLYVSTALHPVATIISESEAENERTRNLEHRSEPTAIGDVLSKSTRMAILGLPGSGKSTLVKRLATYYGQRQANDGSGDSLPNRDWLPLIIRCRQVQLVPNLSIIQLLCRTAESLELTCDSDDFEKYIHYALTSGSALVLVDGLDELPEESARIAFIQQLRTFMSTYPAISVVVTSREAGFRSVAPAVAGTCDLFRLAELDQEKITRLTLAWNREVVGDSEEIRQAATRLANAIWQTERVRRLATNPLLLTTLLLVQRWIGELPRRRSVLYDRAIDVLLMTWNVEGHAPIDKEEALPQLSYVSLYMMERQLKQISISQLSDVLAQARRDMPELLGFAKTSVQTLIARIEDRSGLLVQSGHIVEDGLLRPVYEFKHLTFQEFLAALAVVNGYFEGGFDSASAPEAVVSKHFTDAAWREVIPLTAVLSGRRASGLVSLLISGTDAQPARENSDFDFNPGDGEARHSILLRQCLIDEASVSPDIARRAVESLIRRWDSSEDVDAELMKQLLSGRYGDLFTETLPTVSAQAGSDLWHIIECCCSFVQATNFCQDLSGQAHWKSAGKLINSEDIFEQMRGLLYLMLLAFSLNGNSRLNAAGKGTRQVRSGSKAVSDAVSAIREKLDSPQVEIRCAALWSLAWASNSGLVDENTDLPRTVFRLWRDAESKTLQRIAAWAFWVLPISMAPSPLGSRTGHIRFLRSWLRRPGPSLLSKDSAKAAVVGLVYFGLIDSAKELKVIASQVDDPHWFGWTDKVEALRARLRTDTSDGV